MDLNPNLVDKINLAIEKKNPDKLLSLITENKIRCFDNDIILNACKSNNLEIMYLAINPRRQYYMHMDGDMIVPLKTSKNFNDIVVKLSQIAKHPTSMYIDGFVREILRHCEPRLIKTVFNIIGHEDHRYYLSFYDRNRINALTHRNDLNTFPVDLLPLIFGQLSQYIVEHLKYLTSEIRFPIKDMQLLNLFLKQYGKYYGTSRRYSYIINQILLSGRCASRLAVPACRVRRRGRCRARLRPPNHDAAYQAAAAAAHGDRRACRPMGDRPGGGHRARRGSIGGEEWSSRAYDGRW